MKKSDVQIGGTYVAKVSGQLARVRIDATSPHGGWDATNVDTKRSVRIKSAQRLRRAANDPAWLVRSPETATTSSLPPYLDPVDVARAETELVLGPDPLDSDVCVTPGCGGEREMVYLSKPMCHACWQRQCESDEASPAMVAEADGGADALPQQPEMEIDMAKKNATVKKTEKKASAPKATKPATEKKVRAAKPPAEKKPKKVSALDAAAQVLAKAKEPMHCTEMIHQMAIGGLWSSPGGKTPAATLYAAILREIGTKGKEARFKKVDRGQFAFAG